MNEISSQFSIDTERIKSLGVNDTSSHKSLQIFESGQLTSNERLYFSLWGSKELNSVLLESKKKILQKGEPIQLAYFIVSGTLLSIDGDHLERLGPGSVIGLAEGIKGINSHKTVITSTHVEARILPLNKLINIIPRVPSVIQKIIFNLVNRSI
jgi:CRP-like cAMP-binding protein